MVKMPWNRNRTRPTTAQVPAEVEQYYESTRKERKSIAWLLALGALLLTLIIAAILFFAGRWVYQQFTNNDEPAPATVQQEGEIEQAPASADSGQGPQSAPSQPPADNTPAPSTPPSTPNPSQPTPRTPTTGPAQEIPRTGPTEE